MKQNFFQPLSTQRGKADLQRRQKEALDSILNFGVTMRLMGDQAELFEQLQYFSALDSVGDRFRLAKYFEVCYGVPLVLAVQYLDNLIAWERRTWNPAAMQITLGVGVFES